MFVFAVIFKVKSARIGGDKFVRKTKKLRMIFLDSETSVLYLRIMAGSP